VALEAILLHYIQSKHRIPPEILVRRLSEIEEALKGAPAMSEETLPVPHAKPQAPSTNITLKAVPFNPFSPRDTAKPAEPVLEKVLPDKEEKIFPLEPESPDSKSRVRHETLMRFAAVELEGSLKLNS